jgi:hypothetical protein
MVRALYLESKERRCCRCRAREVDDNLIEIDGETYCKNQEECHQNIISENTKIIFGINGHGKVDSLEIEEKED